MSQTGPNESDKRRGFPLGKVIQGVISLVVIVAIFGFAIPKFASYSEVWPILKGLTLGQILVLCVAFLNLATYWLVYMAALPGVITPGGLGTADAVYMGTVAVGGRLA